MFLCVILVPSWWVLEYAWELWIVASMHRNTKLHPKPTVRLPSQYLIEDFPEVSSRSFRALRKSNLLGSLQNLRLLGQRPEYRFASRLIGSMRISFPSRTSTTVAPDWIVNRLAAEREWTASIGISASWDSIEFVVMASLRYSCNYSTRILLVIGPLTVGSVSVSAFFLFSRIPPGPHCSFKT